MDFRGRTFRATGMEWLDPYRTIQFPVGSYALWQVVKDSNPAVAGFRIAIPNGHSSFVIRHSSFPRGAVAQLVER